MPTTAETRRWQQRLKELALYSGKLDGIAGDDTKAAVRAFQRLHGLRDDGIVGEKTLAELFPTRPVLHEEDIRVATAGASVTWPRQSGCTEFYGKPGNAKCTAGKVILPFPFRIAWNLNQRVSSFQCHTLVAGAMQRIFANAAQHYGEAKCRELGLDLFGGCYNLRKMRGGDSWSMHSWGIAVDLDPANNQLNWGRDKARFAQRAYADFWKIVEAQGAVSLGRAANFDWMHFQFARL